MLSQSASAESDARRRKVRKGTHSCWECRRRKIRCQYTSANDTICIGCRARGSSCRSQEFADEVVAVAPPERKVTQRLDRLESMMERLMEHVLTTPSGGTDKASNAGAESSGDNQQEQSPSSPTTNAAASKPGKKVKICVVTGHPLSDSEDGDVNIDDVYRDPAVAVAQACPRTAARDKYAFDVLETSKAEDTPVATLLGIQDTLSHTSPRTSYTPNTLDSTRVAASVAASNSGSTKGVNPESPADNTTGSAMGSSTSPGSAGTDSTVPPSSFSVSSIIAETSARYRHLSAVLHGLFPSQEDVEVIANVSSAYYVVSLFNSSHDIAQDRCEAPERLTFLPPATSHPAVLARRLLQLTLCMQQMAPCFSMQNRLQLKDGLSETISRISGLVAHTVTADDDLIGNVEGIECLVLMGQVLSNAGHLRKAWLTYRRAMSLAQLMGLDRGNTRALKSCCPRSEPSKRPTPQAIWFRITACDRYVSMLLGLRAGTPSEDDGAFTQPIDTDTAVEKLSKAHVNLTGRIIERNHSRAPADETYTFTKAIDAELQAASTNGFDPSWWELPSYDPYAPPAIIYSEVSRSILQVNHYVMLILLHIPYMLRGEHPAATGAALAAGRGQVGAPVPDCTPDVGIGYSQWVCMRSSRAVLQRFINFRLVVSSAFTCRHIDYATLIAAMTLILGYLGPRPVPAASARTHCFFDSQLHQDRTMVEKVMEHMQNIGKANDDKLSRESAATIQKLLPILDLVERKPDYMPSVPTISNEDEDDATIHLPTMTASFTGVESGGAQFEDASNSNSDGFPGTAAVAAPAASASPVRLNVPYLGTVNINPSAATTMGTSIGSSAAHLHHQHTDVQQAGIQQHTHQEHHQLHSPFGSTGTSSSLLSPGPGQMQSVAPVTPTILGWQNSSTGVHGTLAESTDFNAMLVDFDAAADTSGLSVFGSTPAFPDTTGASDDWVMQGVDTTYWSLLNGGGVGFGGPTM